jgi:hypothetical protein
MMLKRGERIKFYGGGWCEREGKWYACDDALRVLSVSKDPSLYLPVHAESMHSKRRYWLHPKQCRRLVKPGRKDRTP